VSYLHPSLEPVLKETLGVIIYQEQVDPGGYGYSRIYPWRRRAVGWRLATPTSSLP
jgi:hypothetical protein